MVPKHIVSNSTLKDSYKSHTEFHEAGASHTSKDSDEFRETENLGVIEEQDDFQMGRNFLKASKLPEFDWEVKPAIDSAYGSENMPQELDASFSQNLAVTPGQYLLHQEDIGASVMYTGGSPDQLRTDYGVLHVEENE